MCFILQVTEDEKVSTVKELVSERLNIPANQQRLLYKGKALAGKTCLQLYFLHTFVRFSIKVSACLFSLPDEHRLSDYSIGPEAKLNLVIRPAGERSAASAVAGCSSKNMQGGLWQSVSTILARHFSPADAAKVHEQLIKVR